MPIKNEQKRPNKMSLKRQGTQLFIDMTLKTLKLLMKDSYCMVYY